MRNFSELYLFDAYPPMSHPSADPAVNAEIARAAGLDVPDPAGAKILEIGSATGHHILSLASRWAHAECTGIELSGRLVSRARSLARRAGLSNVRLCECCLLQFQPEAEFDFIIAHGFFSWVPDEVKIHLLDFIGKHLSPNGIATVSFNVVAGWRPRMNVVQKVRAIQSVGDTDEITALGILQSVADEAELEIIADMLAKGAEVLAFDDFAPVMDPWSLGAFTKLAQHSNLVMLGDSVSGEIGSDAEDQRVKRTFRSELLCRADAQLLSSSRQQPPAAVNSFQVPAFPKLSTWRMVCVLEGLPVPDMHLNPCVFSIPQLLILSRMDGKSSHVQLAEFSKKHAPELDFIAFLKHITTRGLLA